MPTPDQLATSQTVALMIAPGLEEVEALAVMDVLYRGGVRVDLLSITDSLEVTSSHKLTFRCDALAADTDLSTYTLVMLPGGLPGTSNLQACEQVTTEVTRRVQAGELVAAICAAPSILAELGLLRGRQATANPGFMPALEAGGAAISQAPVVVDGAVLTSRGMGTAIELGLEILRQLRGEEAVHQVQAGIVYQA
ncbi:Chaperone protein YajL [Actinomyces bovis]|uniref:Chaperone protein YajL n=1 Tax=Actinomyces bovis TaxID=1658 RepID=A0ABY1VL37_9ACTO|nr:DJ-1 family glyoxalase III [Actinomyces bovis]SPT52810.1 Chaperone protein YajL [Actinomyces bovis]VEG54858.1 Chaperone protein YajL [Actinomyces israelii]